MVSKETVTENEVKEFSKGFEQIISNIETGFVGKNYTVRLVLAAMMAGGHVLLEDVPGTGKTHLARAMSQSIAGTNKRIQFTPDLLPSDITGVSVYDQKTKEFVFHQGPIFANIVLADEINRTSPKTQSALLEVMEEGNVTVENYTRPVGDPFMVIATQNPIEQQGTYRLPEAQLDRFLIQTSIGHLDEQASINILLGNTERSKLSPVATLEEVKKLKSIAASIHIDPMIANYIMQLVSATREATQVKFGSSIRGALGLSSLAKAWAASQGRAFITPDDVRDLAVPVLAHRIILSNDAEFDGVTQEEVIDKILQEVQVPLDRG
jgi:MoxR-like ATPase